MSGERHITQALVKESLESVHRDNAAFFLRDAEGLSDIQLTAASYYLQGVNREVTTSKRRHTTGESVARTIASALENIQDPSFLDGITGEYLDSVRGKRLLGMPRRRAVGIMAGATLAIAGAASGAVVHIENIRDGVKSTLGPKLSAVERNAGQATRASDELEFLQYQLSTDAVTPNPDVAHQEEILRHTISTDAGHTEEAYREYSYTAGAEEHQPYSGDIVSADTQAALDALNTVPNSNTQLELGSG